MINKLKYATVSDIGIYDLLFYDDAKKKELVKFCKANGISFLPSRNRKMLNRLEQDHFE